MSSSVYVSVSQDFGAEGEQKIELEYEIPKRFLPIDLFLQAAKEKKSNTGLDLIWKFEW